MLLITGSGRSGTSAVAKLLHNAGISVGTDLIEADASNADGYFEERAVIRLNDCILRDTRLNERFTEASREQVLAAAQTYADEMQGLVAAATPAWKDPRFCWTLEAWLGALPERPRIIVCLRSPDEVVASTMRYYGLVDDDAVRAVEHLWRSQYERLLEVIEAHAVDAISVEYDALHRGDVETRALLERFIGRAVAWSGVRAELRHHEGGVPESLAALYERVRSLGRESTEAAATRSDAAAPSASGP